MTRLGARSQPSITVEGVERAVELLSWRLTSEEGDWDIASTAPDRLWYLECEAWQDTERGSLWRFARDNSGAEVAYVVRPHGNAVPTIDAPHYRGRLIVGPKPDLGGDASSRWFPFSFTWLILDEPEEVTE